MSDNKQKIYGPCSVRQQMVLQDNSVDILLTGGGKLVPPL